MASEVHPLRPKKVALFAGHFAPSNLAAVHRSRLWAEYLPELGWEPTIVTTHPRHYEEQLDPELEALLPTSLRIVRTAALPTRPIRLVGDIGVRGLPFHYRTLAGMAERGELDFLHITIPSNFSAVLGRMLKSSHGVPYGIDYIDPWVHEWPGTEVRFSKAWTSARLAEVLEPWAVRDASLITGVAERYFEPVLERNPHLRSQAVLAAMPYGGSERDFERVLAAPRKPSVFDPSDGAVHVVYAGAMLPRAYPVLERLLLAVRELRTRAPALASKLKLHFIGTGKSPDDKDGYNIRPLIEQHGLSANVDEHPARIGYVDVLHHLTQASAVLVLGSTEAHYTPSKAFLAVLSRRPVLALLHAQSTATSFLREANAATVVSFEEGTLPEPAALAETLETFLLRTLPSYDPNAVQWERFEQWSARGSSKILAAALDEALARSGVHEAAGG